MKRLLIVFLCMLLLAAPAQAASKVGNFTVTGGEMCFDFSFDYDADFVVVKYYTSQESGRMTVYGEDGHFEGHVTLVCTYGEDEVLVRVESTDQYFQGKASAKLIPVAAPEAPAPLGTEERPASKVRDLQLTPIDGGIHYSFTAPGHESIRLDYMSSQQEGQYVIYPTEGYAYEGDLILPYTYRKNNVYIELYHATRSGVLAEAQTTCGYTLTAQVEESAPEGRLKGVVVCIDPGHQGIHKTVSEPRGPGLRGEASSAGGMAKGAITRRMESIVALEYSYLLRDELRRQGATVVMTREVEETWLSNIDRCNVAEAAGADFMLRIHLNSNADPTKIGMGVYGPLNSDYAEAAAPREEYRAMGQALLDAMSESVGYEKNRKVVLNNNYVGNNWAKMPCFLLELGYLSTPEEDVRLIHPAYQQMVVEGIAQGVYEMACIRGLVSAEQ